MRQQIEEKVPAIAQVEKRRMELENEMQERVTENKNM